MKIFIVDTNLLYSAVRNIDSRIARVILNGQELGAELFAPTYIIGELDLHFEKLIATSDVTEEEAYEHRRKLFTKITLVEDQDVPISDWFTAARWVRDIDRKDAAFVALNENMDELLWTGDTELYNGLIAKGYTKVVNFSDVKRLLNLPDDF